MNKTSLALGHPSARQLEFLQAEERFVAYGGARGGGKSTAVRMKAVLLAVKHTGIRLLLVRRTLPELRENHILPLLALLGDAAKYKDSEKALLFANGSRLKFGYCENESDVLQYQGQEFDIIFIDEATQLTEFQFNTLSASLRGVNDFPKRIYLTCNPGGVGHGWVKRLFLDKNYRGGERAADYRFIPARVYDNEALLQKDHGYVAMLEALPENLRRAWLLGEWDVFAGQFFTEFCEDIHRVPHFEPPRHWRRYISIDYGLDMLAAYWIAVENGERAVVYRELYRPNLIISQAAGKIRELSVGEDIYLTLAPPDLFSRRQESGRSAADIFAEQGILLTKTGNAREAGWLAVKEWLAPKPDEAGRRTAALTISERCPELLRTLPALCCDSEKPGDVRQAPHELTHAPDALRGFCSYWTSGPEESANLSGWSEDLKADWRTANAEGRRYLERKYGQVWE